MGNVAMVCGGRPGGPEPRSPVTVLQSNGNVLSLYSSRVRVVDLILDHPNHFVCHSSSLVLLHHSKILPLHTLLVPGEVYFLLPMPTRNHENCCSNESDTSSLLHIEPPMRSTKFVISTEQFSRIMAGSIKENHGKQGQTVRRKRQQARASKVVQKTSSGSSNTPMAPWRPALSSIEEVAAN